MRRIPTMAAVALVAVALASSALAAQGAKPAKARELSAVGRVTKFEPSTNSLTISTAKGEETFVLAAHATIRQGAKSIPATELQKAVGHNAKVRYTDANGEHMARSVSIAREAAKTSANKPAGSQGAASVRKH